MSPVLFSYGTLQRDDVQLETFGRLLVGAPDELAGAEVVQVPIDDPEVVAESGMTHYASIVFVDGAGRRVSGVVFEVTAAELASCDVYERDAAYERTVVTLASGREAWVYHRPADADSRAAEEA